MVLRVVGELGGGVPGCRGSGAGWIVSPCRVRAPAGRHIDRLAHQGPVPRVVVPVASPTAFLVQQPGGGRQADRAPPRVRIQVDVAHPLHPRLTGGGDGGAGPFGVAVRPGGPWERTGGAHRLRAHLCLSGLRVILPYQIPPSSPKNSALSTTV